MKEPRFDLHRKDIGFEKDKYTFVGVDNPTEYQAAWQRELEAIDEYKANPYAIGGDLGEKRVRRDPYKRKAQYGDCPVPNWFPEDGLWKILTTR